MEYTKSIGDIYESYEGSPEDISKLMELRPQGVIGVEDEEEELILDEEAMAQFICEKGNLHRGVVEHVLKLQDDYLRKVGILMDPA